jgi:selenocysteine-specific elongation factor
VSARATAKPKPSDKHVVIATAGHVDHGKTSLIRRLTGIDTDRLPDEKRRGISIELGFAELAGTGLSFIDVPGHHKLVHAMIAGVGGVDGVLLIVAADDGVMPQTREHLSVCALLGIERIVVALTKIDLVDAETVELAQADVEATLQSLGLRARTFVRTSAQTGEGYDELERELRELAQDVHERAASARVWLPIDRVFTIKGAGTVVTGTLTRGQISIGQALYVVGARGPRTTACRGLEIHGRAVETARAPTRLALNLTKLEVADLERGEVVSADPELRLATRFDMSLRKLPALDRALKERSAVMVHLGTTRAPARVTRIGSGFAHIVLSAPLPCEGGVGVVLRGFSARRDYGRVLGGGRVLDADAARLPKRRDANGWNEREQALLALEKRELGRALELYLALSAPRPLDAAHLERRFGLEPKTVATTLAQMKNAVALGDGQHFTSEAVIAELIEQLCSTLRQHHRERPHELGLPIETARAALGERAPRELLELSIESAAQRGKVRVSKDALALPEFVESAGVAASEVDTRLLEVVDRFALQGVSESELMRSAGETAERIRASLPRLASAGKARRLGGLWFSERQLSAIRSSVREHLSSHAKLTVADFKSMAGVSRKQAIPLLEQLDREGTTRRVGDDRVLGAAKSK